MAEAAVQPAESKPQVQVPVRAAIHASREIGMGAVFIFAISSIGLIYSGLLPFSTLAGMWPGANLAGMLAVGALVALLMVVAFSAIGAVAPHFGADYLVASRVVSAPLAFASSWTLVIFLAMAGGSIITMIGQNVFPLFARTLAVILADQSLLSYVDWASSSSGTITIGTLGLVLLFLALIAPAQVTHRILLGGSVLAIVALLAVIGILAVASPAQFQNAWDRVLVEANFSILLTQAQSTGMKLDFSAGTMLVAGFMLSLWVFSGAFNPVYFSGEVKNPKRNLIAGSMIAVVAAAALLAAIAVLLQRLVPAGWLSAQSYFYQTGAGKVSAMPWLPYYVALLLPNGLFIRVLGLIWIISFLNMAHTFLYTSSRIILAWGEDHLMPPGATFIHPELRSPLITVLIVCLLAQVGVVESGLNTGINSRINPVFFFVCAELLPVIGITLLPFRQRDWFQRAAGWQRIKIGPLPLISLVGGLAVICLIGMIATLVIWPGYNPLNIDTMLWFAVMFVSGLAWFFGRRSFLNRQGQDIDALLRSAPEE